MAEAIKDGDLELFEKAVNSILQDEGFKISTEQAGKAQLLAERLLRWMVGNDASSFACSLIKDIRKCCTHQVAVQHQRLREKMWENYYKLCSSEQFRSRWVTFIQESIGLHATPIFYQHVTKVLLKEILKVQFPVVDSHDRNPHAASATLDFQERNAIRYCGGYLLHLLKAKLLKSAHPLKESVLLCIEDLLEFAGDNASDKSKELASEDLELTQSDASDSKEWTRAVDRGGLVHIDDSLFHFLVAVELEVRCFFNQHSVKVYDSIKDRAIEGISINEDVLLYWAIVSINWSQAESDELKRRLIEHYVTLRGFSFASGFMEQFKQRSKKSLQKKKGLRKTI